LSFRIGNVAIIADQPDGVCDLCGKTADVRPYGPLGENICWECGQKNPQARDAVMKRVLFGDQDA
jgi:hypothetical protein